MYNCSKITLQNIAIPLRSKFNVIVLKKLSYLFIFFAIAACKSKIYHNTTARYNGYYNATERLKQAQLTLERSNVDDYDKILSVFQFGDEAKSKAVQPDMDEIFKKSGTIIQRHGKSKWVDNCYLLIAKSHFYKRDYYSAIEVLQYINDKYKNTQESYEATIWIMVSKLMLGKNDEAFSVSASLKTDIDKMDEANLAFFYAALAEYHIKQKEYVQAQKNIFKALKFAKGRTYRTRLKFVLAQLYQRNGKTNQAILNYKAVIKRNPPYEMAFNSKLNIGRTYDANKPESLKQARSYLRTMAKDDKNIAYLDKIYYELGNIAQLDSKIDLAINYYKQSLLYFKDQNTKSLSYLALADVYFRMGNYPMSQTYYDSAGMFLNSKYDGYEKLMTKKKVLSEIIKNLLVIQSEDSLQRLGKLSDSERKKIIEKYKNEQDQRNKKPEKARELENQASNNYINPNASNGGYQQAPGDEWYFYNPNAIAIGYSEFVKRWGARNNEDYWFVLDRKTQGNTDDNVNSPIKKIDPNKKDTSNAKEGNITKVGGDKAGAGSENKIPVTPEDINASNNKIIDAFVANGLIYKDKLNDTREAVKIFETLLQRFPENNYLAKVYYYLYKCHDETKNDSLAKKYRDLVLNKFPNSDYADIIKNTAKNSTASGNNEEVKYYEATYDLYKNGNFAEVKKRCFEAHTKFNKSNLLGKFDYLKALSIGKTEGEDKFRIAMEDVVKNYPNTDVYVAANNMLDYLKRKNNPQPEVAVVGNYTYTPANEHYYVMLTDDAKANVETLKANYSDYNAEYHRLESYDISSYILGDKTKIIVVKIFENGGKSIEYYRELVNNTLFFEKAGLEEYSQCVISQDNFKKLMKKKDEEEYLNFFRENYK